MQDTFGREPGIEKTRQVVKPQVFFVLALAAAGILPLLLGRERSFPTAKLFFAGGAGFLCFGMFRLILFSLYRDNLAWFVIWEELTELLTVAALGLFLLVFRKKPLLADRTS